MKIGKKFKSLILVGVLLASLPISALAKGPEKKEINYVALGDSLAVGITPVGEDNLGYPDFLKQRFEQSQYTVDYENNANRGYTSVQLLNDVQNNPDVMDEIDAADFITIDIGANDILPFLNSYLTGIPLPAPFNRVATPQDIINAIGSVGGNIDLILQEINEINPDAKVYVMGYYDPVPHVAPNEQPVIQEILGVFNNTIETAATNNGDTFVPTARIIAKDNDTYLPNPLDIHLSLEGYQLVAKEFWKKIDKSKSN